MEPVLNSLVEPDSQNNYRQGEGWIKQRKGRTQSHYQKREDTVQDEYRKSVQKIQQGESHRWKEIFGKTFPDLVRVCVHAAKGKFRPVPINQPVPLPDHFLAEV